MTELGKPKRANANRAEPALDDFKAWRKELRRSFKRKLLTETEIDSLKVLIDNLGPQLNSYLKSIGKSESQVE